MQLRGGQVHQLDVRGGRAGACQTSPPHPNERRLLIHTCTLARPHSTHLRPNSQLHLECYEKLEASLVKQVQTFEKAPRSFKRRASSYYTDEKIASKLWTEK